MSYLIFDRNMMSNLEEVLNKEILHSNRRGAYYCSTLVGCNTRRYHGALVMPLPDLGPRNFVLLSSIDETVIQHGAEFNLAVHKYSGGHYSPNGHKYIREYDLDKIPKTVFRVGGVILSKEISLSMEADRVMIRYKLIDAHSKTKIRFRPLLAFRSVRELSVENSLANLEGEAVSNGMAFSVYKHFPKLYIQTSKPAKWVPMPSWYKQFAYTKEQERGHAYTEDLPMPGYFELEIEKGETIILSAGIEENNPEQMAENFAAGIEKRTPRTSFKNCLINAADQFIYKPNEKDTYLMSGYPWADVQARWSFIALTGCSYGIKKPHRFGQVWNTLWYALKRFMNDGTLDPIIEDIDKPDVPLWAVSAIIDFSKWEGMEKTKEVYGEALEELMHYLLTNKHPNLNREENGLLYARPLNNRPITWMDSEWDFQPVVPREGFIVEFNALWYNALCFYRDLLRPNDETMTDEIEKVSESFVRTFVNEHNYLFDYVTYDKAQDWSVRPNMIFAVGLSYSPLSRNMQRSVLDIVTKELLTPKGLRTLSPVGEDYKGYCNGSFKDRSLSYHKGGVWSWLMYPYLSAYIKLFRQAGVSFVERSLIPFEDELSQHGIGSISELYDATPPYDGRGAISFAVSVSAILRIKNRLDDVKKKYLENFDIF